MKLVQTLVLGAAIAAASGASVAQFVKGNEAVKVMTDGSRKVETPPLPKATLAAPCPAAKAGCLASGWRMVETQEGLRECTEVYARPGTCQPSTFGTEKRARLWIVKSGSKWLQCQYPDLASKCVSTKALPFCALQ